jgi:hypothetical protein
MLVPEEMVREAESRLRFERLVYRGQSQGTPPARMKASEIGKLGVEKDSMEVHL